MQVPLSAHDLAQVELLVQLDRHQPALDILEALLREGHTDNWEFLLQWLDSVRVLHPEDWDARAIQFAEELDEIAQCRKRAPLLLELEVASRLLMDTEEVPEREARMDVLIDKIIKYYRRFSTKGCCGLDLRQIVARITREEDRLKLSARLKEALEELRCDASELAHVRSRITMLTLESMLGVLCDVRDADAVMSTVEGLVNEYHSLSHLNAELESSERGHGDLILTVAASLLTERWSSANCKTSLLKAMQILTQGLSLSPCNFEFTLALLRLYCEAGSPKKAYELFNSLSIKHIQLESMSHEVMEPLLSSGLSSILGELCSKISLFQKHSSKDVADYTANCYRQQKYHKLPEFYKLLNRLSRGEARWSAAVLQAHIGMCTQNLEALDVQDWSSVKVGGMLCNNDEQAIPDWSKVSVESILPLGERSSARALSAKESLRLQQRVTGAYVAQTISKFQPTSSNADNADANKELIERLEGILSSGGLDFDTVAVQLVHSTLCISTMQQGPDGIAQVTECLKTAESALQTTEQQVTITYTLTPSLLTP